METSIHEAKTQLSRLIERAMAGEEVIIARGKKPLVKLVPIREPAGPREIGGFSGEYFIGDDFNEPLAAFADYMPPFSGIQESATVQYGATPGKPTKPRAGKGK